MWKVNWSTCHKCGTKKKSESLTRIKPVTSQTPGGGSIYWAIRTHGEQGHLTEVICDRHPAYCDQLCWHHHKFSDKWMKIVIADLWHFFTNLKIHHVYSHITKINLHHKINIQLTFSKTWCKTFQSTISILSKVFVSILDFVKKPLTDSWQIVARLMMTGRCFHTKTRWWM